MTDRERIEMLEAENTTLVLREFSSWMKRIESLALSAIARLDAAKDEAPKTQHSPSAGYPGDENWGTK